MTSQIHNIKCFSVNFSFKRRVKMSSWFVRLTRGPCHSASWLSRGPTECADQYPRCLMFLLVVFQAAAFKACNVCHLGILEHNRATNKSSLECVLALGEREQVR